MSTGECIAALLIGSLAVSVIVKSIEWWNIQESKEE